MREIVERIKSPSGYSGQSCAKERKRGWFSGKKAWHVSERVFVAVAWWGM